MLRMLMLLGTAGLVACGDKDDSSDTGGTDDTDNPDVPACTNSISETFPESGDAEAFYRTNVEFKLVTAEPDATITVTDASGAEVAGTTEVDGTTVRFTPSTGFQASTAYTATLDYSCEDASISFTTSDVGTAVSDPSTLVGNVYTLPLTEGRFVEPPGIGPILAGVLTVNVLIEVTEATATEVKMMGAVSADGNPNAQDMCTETIDFPTAADFSENPFFAIGPEDTTLSVAGYSVTIDDLEITGAFAADGSSLQGATLAGSIDTRPLAPLVGVEGDDGVCELLGGFGIACVACSDGSGDFCLALEVQDMTAELVPGLDIMPRTQADIEADSACAAE